MVYCLFVHETQTVAERPLMDVLLSTFELSIDTLSVAILRSVPVYAEEHPGFNREHDVIAHLLLPVSVFLNNSATVATV